MKDDKSDYISVIENDFKSREESARNIFDRVIIAASKDENDHNLPLRRVAEFVSGAQDILINGQQPDARLRTADLLIHGGRVVFDLSGLNTDQQKGLFDQLTCGRAKPRGWASHGFARVESGHGAVPVEIKTGPFYAFLDFFKYIYRLVSHSSFGRAVLGLFGGEPSLFGHYSVPLAIGGEGDTPEPNGGWGEMYVHYDQDSNGLMIGFEPSGTGKKSQLTGVYHSMVGSTGDLSPFLATKIDKDIEARQSADFHPLSQFKGNKYNWARVVVSQGDLDKKDYSETPACSKVENYNLISAKAWAKKNNKVSPLATMGKVFSVLVAFFGIYEVLVAVAVIETMQIASVSALLGVAIGPVGGLVLGSVFGVLLVVAAISFGAQCIKRGSSAPGIAAGGPKVLNARNDVASSRSVEIKQSLDLNAENDVAPSRSVETREVLGPGRP